MPILNRTQVVLAALFILMAGLGAGYLAGHLGLFNRWPATTPQGSTDEMAGMDHSQHQMPALSPEQDADRKVAYWYDPMHPGYRSDKPGIAPDCGMDLVPRYEDELLAIETRAPGTVVLSAQRQQLIGVRTGPVVRERLTRTLRTTGRVEVDETRVERVHTRVEGWVEKVLVDFEGKLVGKGQPLFTLYSPELVSTQEEYLLARRGQERLAESSFSEVSKSSETLLQAARERLRLWEVSAEQVAHLEETGQVQRTLTVASPVTGHVLKRAVFPQTFVKPEMALYEIADLSTVWVQADVFEFEASSIRVGQRATLRLSYEPGRSWRGRVSYIYPTVDPQTRSVQVRIEVPNRGMAFKPEMFADVEIEIDYGSHTLIPREALLDTGKRKIVYLAHSDGVFEPREVVTGPEFDGRVAILAGLKPGDTIVLSGNFLLDSESRLTTAPASATPDHTEHGGM